MNDTLPNILKVEAKQKLIETAKSIVKNQIGIVEGCRSISKLIHKAEIAEDEIFLPIIAVDSETDDIPLGKARDLWNQDALRKIDEEKQKYEARNKLLIINVCKEIIKKYSPVPT